MLYPICCAGGRTELLLSASSAADRFEYSTAFLRKGGRGAATV